MKPNVVWLKKKCHVTTLVISVAPGIIVTARKFDRERQREYAVTVTATDQAADPLIGICQLNILILDQNDNSPKFENIRYECKCGSTLFSKIMFHRVNFIKLPRIFCCISLCSKCYLWQHWQHSVFFAKPGFHSRGGYVFV